MTEKIAISMPETDLTFIDAHVKLSDLERSAFITKATLEWIEWTKPRVDQKYQVTADDVVVVVSMDVAVGNDRVTVLGATSEDGSELNINGLVTDSDSRNRGYGSLALESLVEFAVKHDFDTITADRINPSAYQELKPFCDKFKFEFEEAKPGHPCRLIRRLNVGQLT